jgi:hypothetical protein
MLQHTGSSSEARTACALGVSLPILIILSDHEVTFESSAPMPLLTGRALQQATVRTTVWEPPRFLRSLSGVQPTSWRL